MKMAVAIGATGAIGDLCGTPSDGVWRERRELFPEGVASGDPDSNSVILWTRYPRVEEKSSGELLVEVAEDQLFQRVIAKSKTPVLAVSDYTCRVLVGGLKPGSVYWAARAWTGDGSCRACVSASSNKARFTRTRLTQNV